MIATKKQRFAGASLMAISMACVSMGTHPVAAREEPPQASPEDITFYIRLLRASSPDDQESAANYLAKSGPRAFPALKDLRQLVDEDLGTTCIAAVRAICAIGPQAADAITDIVRMSRRASSDSTRRPDSRCEFAADGVIAQIGPAAISYLVAELGVDPETDHVPANMLAAFGPDAIPPVVELLEAGGDRAAAAADAIWRIRSLHSNLSLDGVDAFIARPLEAGPALPALVKALRRGKISERTFISTFEGMGVSSREILEELRRLSQSAKRKEDRDRAAAVLREIQESPPGSADPVKWR